MFGNTYILMMPPSQNQGYSNFGNPGNQQPWYGSQAKPALNAGNAQVIGNLTKTMGDIISLLQQLLNATANNSALNGGFGQTLASPNLFSASPGPGFSGNPGYDFWGGNDLNNLGFNNINFNGSNNGGFNAGLINNDLNSLFNGGYISNPSMMQGAGKQTMPKAGKRCGKKSFLPKPSNCKKTTARKTPVKSLPVNPDYSNWNGNGMSNTGVNSINFNGNNNGGINIGIINNYYMGAGQQAKAPEYNGGTDAKYWGDPHLEGFDGEKYEVRGEDKKYYNMLSDQNVQYNTKFESWGSGAVVTQAGIQVGRDKVYYDRTMDSPTINGKPMTIPAGHSQVTEALDDNGSALWDGSKLTVYTKEYTLGVEKKVDRTNGNYLNSTVKINQGGPYQDYVAPHGLLGQTADNIAGKKHSGRNHGKQGGTVIDGTVSDYEVSDIWSANDKYNRFGRQVAQTTTDWQGNVVQTVDANGNVLYRKPALSA